MYYFIPAWYGSERIWHNTTTPWYWSKDMIEFDETIHQVRVFHEAGVDRKLVIPHYCPQLRYYLHRQDLLETDYLSTFDHIQGVSPHQEMVPIPVSYTHLDVYKRQGEGQETIILSLSEK